MRHRLIKLSSVAGVIVVAVVSFQNCGKAGFEGMNQQSSQTIETAATDEYPFAFEASFDQISYNSCYGIGAQRPGFFSLMAGAYDSTGLKIKPEFFSAVRTKVKPIYPEPAVTPLQIKKELAVALNSMDAVPQMAVRMRGQPQQIRTPARNGTATAPVEGLDFVSMLGDPTDDRWMDPLIKNEASDTFTRFFNLAPSNQRNLEAKITYNDSEALVEGFRNDLSQYGRLSLTFRPRADQGDSSMARPVAKDLNKVHGRGYDLTFERVVAPFTLLYGHGSAVYVNAPSNILTSVQEIDLANTASVTGTWSCHQARRYVIVKQADRAAACPTDPYSYMVYGLPSAGMSAAAYRKEHEIMRRHLKAEYWDISVEFRCAVPKAVTTGTPGECYPAEKINGQDVGIEYDQTQPCYRGIAGINYGSSIPIKRCAQYVSVCTRN